MKNFDLENDQNDNILNETTILKTDLKQSEQTASLVQTKKTESVTKLSETNHFWTGQITTQKQSWASMMNNSQPVVANNETVINSANINRTSSSTTTSNPSGF